MFNVLKKFLPVFLSVFMIVSYLPIISEAAGHTYYVAINGSDENSGTNIDNPFKTITAAAKRMTAGDTCYIRGGVYYESIATGKNREYVLNGTADSKIRFLAYNGETVTISGGEIVSAWTMESENIWKANVSTDLDGGDRNMVFKDGIVCPEARWPNLAETSLDEHPLLNRNSYARIDSTDSSRLIITDSSLPENIDLTGASVWCASGVAYWSYLSKITAHNQSLNSLTLSDVFDGVDYRPKANNLYYVTGSKALLDSEGEWYKDTQNGILYYYTENEAGPGEVEVRKREHTLLLQDSSHVVFDGIDFRGGIVRFIGSNYCTLKNSMLSSLDYRMPFHKESYSYARPGAEGVILDGDYLNVENCEIKNMFGEGIAVYGDNCRVVNNYIHDINFEHTYSDGIYIEGSKNLVSYNTVKRTGRSTIGGRFKAGIISYNDLSDANRLSQDSGVLYFNAKNYQNTELHHNVIRDSLNNEGMQYGLYLDSFTSGMLIYNNLIYGQESEAMQNKAQRFSLVLGPNSIGNIFMNNTIINNNPVGGLNLYDGLADRSGTVFLNNLFANEPFSQALPSGMIDQCSIVESNAFTDADAFDFTLTSASQAIDAGEYIPGIGNYSGSAPDCGAFEFSNTAWKAGHDFSKDYSHVFYAQNEQLPYRNVIANGGFEDELNEWNSISGLPGRFKSSTWEMFGSFTKDGAYSLYLSDGDEVSQTIIGLKPDTTYEISGYGMLGSQIYNVSTIDLAASSSNISLNSYAATGLQDGSVICCKDIGFGNGEYDRIMLGMKYPYGKTTLSRQITIRKGSPEGTTIAEFTTGNDNSKPYYMWTWDGAEMTSAVSGNNDLYLCFEGDFSGVAFGGIYLDDSDGNDTIRIEAVSDLRELGTVTIDSRAFDIPVKTTTITTGELGRVTISISKNSGNLKGYIDFVSLREKNSSSGSKDDVYHTLVDYLVTDENDRQLYGIHKGDSHKVSGTMKNHSTSNLDITVKLEGFDGNNVLFSQNSVNATASAGSIVPFCLTGKAALTDGAYFKLTLLSAVSEVCYMISDRILEEQYTGNDDIIVKDVCLRNVDGNIIETIVGEEFNFFDITLKNKSQTEIPMIGVLAIYNGNNQLIELMRFNRTISADGIDRFLMGRVMPKESGIHGKIFCWNNLKEMQPILEAVLFE